MTTTPTPAAPSDTPVATLPADRAGGTHAPRPVTYIDEWPFCLPRRWFR